MNAEYETSVTRWFQELKAGNQDAASHLWQAYFDELVRLARKRMGGIPRRVVDEEDVAISVFRTLCDGAAAGRFAAHMDRTDLWKLLVVVTQQKVTDHVREATAAKRGGGRVQGESAFIAADCLPELTQRGIEQVAEQAPTPDFLAAVEEQRLHLESLLDDKSLVQIARLRLEGHSNEEIAKSMKLSVRSVERKLKLIRDRWATDFAA